MRLGDTDPRIFVAPVHTALQNVQVLSPHKLLQFRPLGIGDQDKLWHWLHVALWDPPPAGLRPKEVLQAPGVRIYAEEWGRPSDVGVVAQVNGMDAGAC